ncbi:MAG: hypothetical protein HYZ83_08715, partial [Candidatus Omnitrophica bacterium]|nr:hypothetical protein [Candidatus Omnitrophota bacterium]
MALSQYHGDRKPLALRVTSAFVIFTFLITQSDLRLASAFSAPASPTDIAVTQNSLQDSKEDIHYMQDPNAWQWDSKSISPAEAPVGQATQKAAQAAAPPIPSSIFEKNQTPLSHAEGEAVETIRDGKIRYTYANQSYFEVYSEDEDDLRLKGKISEIGDFTNPDNPNQLEVRKFYYLEDKADRAIVRIVTENPGRLPTYQIFDDLGGQIKNLRESGVIVNGKFLAHSIYDAAAGRAIFHDLLNAYFEVVHEMTADYKIGRLLEYQNREGDKNAHLQFLYDDTKQRVTSINWETEVYSIYEFVEGKAGRLLEFGVVAPEILSPAQLNIRYSVEISEFERTGESMSVYVFRDPKHPDDFLIRERLAAAGIGRILRWRSYEGDPVDLEYFYDKDKATGIEVVTVFNYIEGTYLKMEFDKDADRDGDGLLDNPGKVIEAGIISKGVQRELKTILKRQNNQFEIVSNDGTVRLYEASVDNQIGRLLRLRGPPSGDPNQFVDVIYQYDGSTNTRIAYDLTHKTYSLTTFENTGAGQILETGTFTISSDGSYLRTKTTESTLSGETIRFSYDAIESRSFDYAYAILEEGKPAAVIVDRLSPDDIRKLLALPFEVGITVMNGRVVLFASSEGQEIRMMAAVKTLIEGADLIAHTHPENSTPLQHGPSQQDIQAASPERIEYVLTSEGVFAFNGDGKQSSKKDFSEFSNILQAAGSHWKEDDQKGEMLARLKLQQFISSMDLLAGAIEEEITEFRAGDLSADQEQAVTIGKEVLKAQLGLSDVQAADIATKEVRNTPAANVFLISLDYQNTTYDFSVNITDGSAILLKIKTAAEIREFDNQGRLTQIMNMTDTTLRIYEGYDDIAKRYTVKFFTTLAPTQASPYIASTFSYGPDNQAVTGDDVLLRTETVQPDGIQVEDFDAQGRLVKRTQGSTVTTFSYNDTAKTYAITSGSTVQTLTYGVDNQPGTNDDVLLKEEERDENDDQITREFDTNGNIVRVLNETQGTSTNYSYPSAGQVLIKESDGTYTIAEYDSANRRIGRALSNGAVKNDGSLEQEESFEYTMPGRVIVKGKNSTYRIMSLKSNGSFDRVEEEGKIKDDGSLNRGEATVFDWVTIPGKVVEKNLKTDTYQIISFKSDGTFDRVEEEGKIKDDGTVNRSEATVFDWVTVPGKVVE